MSQIKDYVPREDNKNKYVCFDNGENEELRRIIKELVGLMDDMEYNSGWVDKEDDYDGFTKCVVCEARIDNSGHLSSCPFSKYKNIKYYAERRYGIQFDEKEK